MRHLIAALGDEHPSVAAASVGSLERLRDPEGAMPLYELVQNELADPMVRRRAAEVLVGFGLLRRPQAGASRLFLWLAGLTLVIVSVGAASMIGAWAVALFLAGSGLLAAYALREARRGAGTSDVYIGPNGEELRLPAFRRREEIWGEGPEGGLPAG